jgi:hypothetical protein
MLAKNVNISTQSSATRWLGAVTHMYETGFGHVSPMPHNQKSSSDVLSVSYRFAFYVLEVG